MNKVPKGIKEAITGIVMGFLLTTIVDSFVKDGLLPGYSKWFFVLIGIVGGIGIIKLFRSEGVLYLIGWVIGSWLLRDLFGPADYAFYIVVPIVILVIKAWFWFKGRGSGGWVTQRKSPHS